MNREVLQHQETIHAPIGRVEAAVLHHAHDRGWVTGVRRHAPRAVTIRARNLRENRGYLFLLSSHRVGETHTLVRATGRWVQSIPHRGTAAAVRSLLHVLLNRIALRAGERRPPRVLH
jgi:hypothetical protein